MPSNPSRSTSPPRSTVSVAVAIRKLLWFIAVGVMVMIPITMVTIVTSEVDPTPIVESLLSGNECVHCRAVLGMINQQVSGDSSILTMVSRGGGQASFSREAKEAVAEKLVQTTCGKLSNHKQPPVSSISMTNCSAFVKTHKDALADHILKAVSSPYGLVVMPKDCPVLPKNSDAISSLLVELAAPSYIRTAAHSKPMDPHCLWWQHEFMMKGTGSICYPYCEGSLSVLDRGVIALQRYAASTPAVRLLALWARELWGTLLFLGLEGGLVALIVYLRFSQRTAHRAIVSLVSSHHRLSPVAAAAAATQRSGGGAPSRSVGGGGRVAPGATDK